MSNCGEAIEEDDARFLEVGDEAIGPGPAWCPEDDLSIPRGLEPVQSATGYTCLTGCEITQLEGHQRERVPRPALLRAKLPRLLEFNRKAGKPAHNSALGRVGHPVGVDLDARVPASVEA